MTHVSVPEKTLEHWASLCIAYRYRSLAAQWWPVNGVDIDVRLTHEFLGKIDQSDAIYVIDQDGYTGRSVCIEIGYASALGRTVLLSEPAAENAVKALTNEVIAVGDITRQIKP